MISKHMEKLVNEQYHREIFSVHQYLAMCSWFLERDLDGFAHFFRMQADEETMHALKQFDYLHEVDGKITLGAIDAPQNEFKTIEDVFEQTLAHEREITGHIHAIVKAALEESDFATHQFFQWFVQEQVEEESTVRSILAKLRLAEGNKSSLYLLNEELLKRKPTVADA